MDKRRIVPIWTGMVTEGGRLELDRRDLFAKYVAKLKGERVRVEVSSRLRQRSLSQNSYWWGVVCPLLAGAIGLTTEQVHEALKRKYLPILDGDDGPELMRLAAGSTRKQTAAEFSELIEQVIADAATGELTGSPVIIPFPGEIGLQEIE